MSETADRIPGRKSQDRSCDEQDPDGASRKRKVELPPVATTPDQGITPAVALPPPTSSSHRTLAETFLDLNLTSDWINVKLRSSEKAKEMLTLVELSSPLGPIQCMDTKISCLSLFLGGDSLAAAGLRKGVAEGDSLKAVIEFLVEEKEKELNEGLTLREYLFQLHSRDPLKGYKGYELLRSDETPSSDYCWLPSRCLVLAMANDTTPLSKRCKVGKFPYQVNDELMALAKGTKNDQLIIISGESGSGKTLGMIGIARYHYESPLVLYFEVSAVPGFYEKSIKYTEALKTLLKGRNEVSEGEFNLLCDARNKAFYELVCATILSLIRLAVPNWGTIKLQEDAEVVSIVIDEIGAYPVFLSALSCVHNQVSDTIRTQLKVKGVKIICGGTGADARRAPGSNEAAYYALALSPLTPTQWERWGQSFTKGSPRMAKVQQWLGGSQTKLVGRVKSLLTNWRLAVHLLDELCNLLDADDDGELFALESAPRAIETCMSNAMTQYKNKSSLRKFRRATAAVLGQLALAYHMMAVKNPLDGTRNASLVETWGLLADRGGKRREHPNWPKESTACVADPPLPELGVPRYVMSPALQTMTILGLGLNSDVNFSRKPFEAEMAMFFFYVFQSACVLKAEGFSDGTVLLRTDWTRALDPTVPAHHLQIDSGMENTEYMKMFRSYNDLHGTVAIPFDKIPLLGSSKTAPQPQTTFLSVNALLDSVEPPESDGENVLAMMQEFVRTAPQLTKEEFGATQRALLTHLEGADALLKKSLESQEIWIFRNTPDARFADVIIINNSTRELWLIRCKSFTGQVCTFDFAIELEKLGYGATGSQSHSTTATTKEEDEDRTEAAAVAEVFRRTLQILLGDFSVRYLFCLNLKYTEALHTDFVLSARQAKAPNVHILCNGFGFCFDPIDLSYLVSDARAPQFCLQGIGLSVQQILGSKSSTLKK